MIVVVALSGRNLGYQKFSSILVQVTKMYCDTDSFKNFLLLLLHLLSLLLLIEHLKNIKCIMQTLYLSTGINFSFSLEIQKEVFTRTEQFKENKKGKE
jgi:hypothetical protein